MTLVAPIRPRLVTAAWLVARRRRPQHHRAATVARLGLSALLFRRHPRTAIWIATRRHLDQRLRAGSVGFALGVAAALAAHRALGRHAPPAVPETPVVSASPADAPSDSAR